MKAAFAQPGFRRLFAGLSTSMLGDSIMLLVLSIWVKTLTGSSAMAGFTFFFMCIPAIFAPLVGVWIDRIRRKPMLVWGNLLSAVAVLPLLLVRDAGDVWIIWTVAGLYGVSFVVLPAGLNGLLKELMPEELLVDANSSIQTVKESYRLFGPLLGAALFAWLGGWAVALVDAASFLLAAAVISTIRVEEDAPEHEESAYWSQLTEGLRHLVHDRVLGNLLIGFGLSMLVLGFTESAIFALTDHFGKAATYVSVLVSVQGIGAVVGGVLSARCVRRLGEVATSTLGLVLLGVSALGMAAPPSIAGVLVSIVLFGASLPLLVVAYMTILQRRTPQRLMGRVSTAAEVVMTVPSAISLAFGAVLVTLLDWRWIFLVIGLATLAGAGHVAFWLRDELRGRTAEPDVVDEPPAPLDPSSPLGPGVGAA
ncbi:MFS transporter [Microbacterium sp. ARD31]|uniref:MFS transporter n=1 Tax=Microbacterium sp. ARD31 TaxID=2962576 RepID=UPI002881B1D0|nr:MFS transporter [Microbacterium sp. ARD31]MDT0183346.1 MFS transporter [Microbacterium sp. ARD31]